MGDESRSDLLADKEKLFGYLSQHMVEMRQVLTVEADFCNQDVDSSMKHIEMMEQKFQAKIQQLKKKLENIQSANSKQFQEHLDQLTHVSESIQDLYTAGRYSEALDDFENHQRSFQTRKQLNRNIPKLHMNEHDIERHFSGEQQPKPPVVQLAKPKASAPQSWIIDDDEAINEKGEIRAKKAIESDTMHDEDKSATNGKDDHEPEKSLFGIRSRPPENQPEPPLSAATTNNTRTTGNPSSVPAAALPSKFLFGTRLNSIANKPNGAPSDRHPPPSPPSPPSSVPSNNGNAQNDYGQSRSTTTEQQASPTQKDQSKPLTMNPIVLYTFEDNHHLLMACVARDIVLFKCQRNRLDRWRLDTIERSTNNVRELSWHDGLLISIGFTNKQLLYMFTEREFLIYSMRPFQKLVSRILPRGNDDECHLSTYSYPASQRGIGTVYDKHMYHIYLNRKNHWTLSKHILQEVVHMHDKDLTLLFPDVERFIQFCMNEKTIGFLVQMFDYSYAVVFCSTHDYNTIDYPSPVILSDAHLPLTICCAFIPLKNQFQFYINDPSIDVLHVISTTSYLHFHPVTAHAICHVVDRRELMIVTDNSICSLNIN